jgi:hypothetical protein
MSLLFLIGGGAGDGLLPGPATATWTNGNISDVWSDPDNWDGAELPGTITEVTFDSTSTDDCTVDLLVVIKSLLLDATYAPGTLDIGFGLAYKVLQEVSIDGGTFDLGSSPVEIGDDFKSLAAAILDLGSAQVIVGGNLNLASTTLTGGTSLITMTGASKTLEIPNSTIQTINDLTITGTVDHINSASTIRGDLEVSGSLNLSARLTIANNASAFSELRVKSGGTITGAQTLSINTGMVGEMSGTITVSKLQIRGFTNSLVAQGNYGATDVEILNTTTTGYTVTFESGVFVFTGNIEVAADNTGHIIWDCTANDPDVSVNGDIFTGGGGAGTKTFRMGDGDWTIGGDFLFDGFNSVSFGGNSTVTMTGDNTDIEGGFVRTIGKLIIASGIRVDISGTQARCSGLEVNGDYFASGGVANVVTGDVEIKSGATVDGGGWLLLSGDSSLTEQNGSVLTAIFSIDTTGTVLPATYDADLSRVRNASTTNRTFEWSSGTYIFNGDFVYQLTSTGDLTIDNSVNNPDITIDGDMSEDISGGGTFSYTRGTGTIKLTGATAAQNIDAPNATYEDIEIDAPGTTYTMQADLTCKSMTITNGSLDENGFTLTQTG